MKRLNTKKMRNALSFFVPSGEAIPKMLNSTAMFVKNERYRSLLSGAALAYTMADNAHTRWLENREDTTYTVVVTERDPLFDAIQKQVILAQPDEERHQIEISSGTRATNDYGRDSDTPTPNMDRAIVVSHYGSSVTEITLAGHQVKVKIGADGPPEDTGRGAGGSRTVAISKLLTIYCETIEARNDVVDLLNGFALKAISRKPRFYEAAKWGSFRFVKDTPVRPVSSVVLKEGQMDRIFEAIRTFLAAEKEYVRLGIPYRTGILLYGNPGTGKTSVASALAHELGLDIFNISLSTIEDDSALMELFQEITPRSVVLLEDVDVNHSATERTDEVKGVTMSGLLNALDGVATPHGLITVMTTNHIDSLDPALVRSGRVDTRELISEIDNYQLNMLCLEFLGTIPDNLPSISEEDGIVAADIMDVFKRNIQHMDKAGADLVAYLGKKKEKRNAKVPSPLQN